jgi:hypothetical protein
MTPAARRAAARERQRRWRQRQRDKLIAVNVEVDGAAIDWLVEKVRVLPDTMKHKRREIGAAISRMIRHSSRV